MKMPFSIYNNCKHKYHKFHHMHMDCHVFSSNNKIWITFLRALPGCCNMKSNKTAFVICNAYVYNVIAYCICEYTYWDSKQAQYWWSSRREISQMFFDLTAVESKRFFFFEDPLFLLFRVTMQPPERHCVANQLWRYGSTGLQQARLLFTYLLCIPN